MSRPKHWYYGNVIRICKAYPFLKRCFANDVNLLSWREIADMKAVQKAFEKFYDENTPVANEIYFCAVERYEHGNSYERIGDMCGLSEPSVKRRVLKFNRVVAENLGYAEVQKDADA